MRTETFRPFLFAAVLTSALALPGAVASAHFRLESPPAAWEQNAQGNPQKTSPCGGGTMPTGEVTAVQSGGTITLTIDETVFHPGHYRIAIAQDESGLPAAPEVTAGATDCGSVPIDPDPQLPVIADGIFEHDAAFGGPQTMDITLPDGFTCDGCVLQVLEFMSSHAAPCFYYHCANVTVEGGPTTTSASSTSNGAAATGSTKAASVAASSGNGAGTTSGGTSGSGGGAGADDDDGCAVSPKEDGARTAGVVALFVVLSSVALRRRKR